MAVLQSEEVRTNRIIMAENTKNVVLKGGHIDDYDNPYLQRNWFISALARPNCPKCYQ